MANLSLFEEFRPSPMLHVEDVEMLFLYVPDKHGMSAGGLNTDGERSFQVRDQIKVRGYNPDDTKGLS
ncbi:hypothetical protein N7447_003541 [Penicillium robsamsonii]|uniref:uncharacterized protein n=1 Tax=Penicillium robsamsonii TaxID=1792511 RepID=UPI002546D2FB|nr:uncharacterized protein N7447_003541 [Penicillium robsamsonii]KAJ5826778.1 hypothetical protein N7447_003541 [Penicillium robsamsonii]